MDWSKMHTLHVTRPTSRVLRLLRGAVPQLKHIDFVGGSPRDSAAIVEFIANTALPLESLNLRGVRLENWNQVVDSIINRHGLSLKHLVVTSRDKSQKSRLLLNETTISQLYYSCPSLETIDLDIDTTLKWNYPLLNELASHPSLRHLGLRTETQRRKPQTPQGRYKSIYNDYDVTESGTTQIVVNTTTSVGLFRYLRKQKIGQQLETLHVRNFLRTEGEPKETFHSKYVCFVNASGVEVCELSYDWYE